jgi:hypothetical protein
MVGQSLLTPPRLPTNLRRSSTNPANIATPRASSVRQGPTFPRGRRAVAGNRASFAPQRGTFPWILRGSERDPRGHCARSLDDYRRCSDHSGSSHDISPSPNEDRAPTSFVCSPSCLLCAPPSQPGRPPLQGWCTTQRARWTLERARSIPERAGSTHELALRAIDAAGRAILVGWIALATRRGRSPTSRTHKRTSRGDPRVSQADHRTSQVDHPTS